MASAWAALAARSVRATAVPQTETLPTTETDQGVSLDGVASVAVVASAPAGQTFDGTGSFKALFYCPLMSKWVRAPLQDVTDLTRFSGEEHAMLPALDVIGPVGRFMYAPVSVGLSSGTTLTMNYLCSAEPAKRTEAL